MDYFIFVLNSFCLVVQGVMHLLFISRLTGKTPKLCHFAAYLSLLCAFEWIFGRFSLAWIPAVAGELLILYGLCRFALGNRPAVSWTAAILALYISQLSFGLVNSAESLLFPYLVGNAFLYVLILLAMAAAFSVCACCYILVAKSLSLEEVGQDPDNGPLLFPLLLFPVLFFFTAELYIIQTSYTQTVAIVSSRSFSLTEAGKHVALLVLQALGLGALLCTIYAYRRVCRGFEAQAALTSLTQAAQAQKIYVAEAQARYEQTRAFRHDIKNHLSVLSRLLSGGKQKEAADYLHSLESISSSLSFPYQTGNPVVDILLSEKLSLAKACGIEAEVSLILPKSCGIDDFDLCVIFANALDNAVNACRAANGARSVRIFGERQGDLYMLEFENTCPDEPLPPMGTGLKNIQTAAEKYHGTLLAEKDGPHFSLNVLLNISLHPEDIPAQKP